MPTGLYIYRVRGMLVRFFKTFKNGTYNLCRVIKIGEQVNQGLKDALHKKIRPWANGFPLAEPYF